MANKVYNIELTKLQVENLIDFFEINFIDSIRNDTDIDNIEYVCEMCNIYQVLTECVRGADNAE